MVGKQSLLLPLSPLGSSITKVNVCVYVLARWLVDLFGIVWTSAAAVAAVRWSTSVAKLSLLVACLAPETQAQK